MNLDYQKDILKDTIDRLMNFRNVAPYRKTYASPDYLLNSIVDDLPIEPSTYEQTTLEFKNKILDYCVNDTNPSSMGFPDSGNNLAALVGTLYAEFVHQNLINQQGSAPSATFAEIAVIRWIRQIVGYKNCSKYDLKSVYDIGGILTFGGTMSNTIAMMLARGHKDPSTIKNGIRQPKNFKVLIPEDIEHYSINASLKWLGLGDQTIKVKTKNFKFDINDLRSKLIQYKGKIMACVVYAGDSKSMTIDELSEIYNLVKSYDPSIWMHCDACHGFSLGFSDSLAYKISGIEQYDSITTDIHKVLMTPYGLSLLLVKKPSSLNLLRVDSDLILQSQSFALGQVTPFIGSKNASCFKLWFLMKGEGKHKIGKIIDRRHEMALYFASKISNLNGFIRLNDVVINSVMFAINPFENKLELNTINAYNRTLFQHINNEGRYYLHSFPVRVNNHYFNTGNDRIICLRYMSGNPEISTSDIDDLVSYLLSLRKRIKFCKEDIE